MERKREQLRAKQWGTLYSPFLFVFAGYFYAMATFHLQGCPVRLHCLHTRGSQ